jgi:hypothetical protein
MNKKNNNKLKKNITPCFVIKSYEKLSSFHK